MIIRKARAGDCNEILKIAESLNVKDVKSNNGGFLVYVLDKKGYKDRIKDSDYFYVAEDEGNVKGFLMCYSSIALEKIYSSSKIAHEDDLIKYVLTQKKPFLFGDQIGIKNEFSRTGIGRSLMEKIILDMKNENIFDFYACILHDPVKNNASISFTKSFGFGFLKEIKNKDGRVWGVYLLKL